MTLVGSLEDLYRQTTELHQALQDTAGLAADEGYARMVVADVQDLADAADDLQCRIDQTLQGLRSTV